MRLDLAHPAVEKVTLVLEGIGGDKIRIDSTSLDQPLTVLPDQAPRGRCNAASTVWLNLRYPPRTSEAR